jgi:hypothetical protein
VTKASTDELRLYAWNVPPRHAGLLIAELKLSRIEESSATFWGSYPRDQFRPREVEAIARRLRHLGLNVTVTGGRSTEQPHGKRTHVIGDQKQPKKRLRTGRAT